MKKSAIFLLAICAFLFQYNFLNAQCPPSTIILETQADVDNFTTNFPGCTMLNAGLTIGPGSPSGSITDLSALSGIQEVTGTITIKNNDALSGASQMTGLTTTGGGFVIQDNLLFNAFPPNLSSFEGSLIMERNNALTDFDISTVSTSNIVSIIIRENAALISAKIPIDITAFSGSLQYRDNPLLTEVSESDNVVSIGGFLSIYDTKITDLPDFPNLTTISGDLYIIENSEITQIPAFQSLSNFSGNLSISDNAKLTDFDLSAVLTSNVGFMIVNDNPLITSAKLPNDVTTMGGQLQYRGSPLLAEISPMPALTSIAGYLSILDSPLASFPDFSSLTSIGTGLYINNNDNITALPVMPNLNSLSGVIDIQNNPLLTSFDLSAVATSNIHFMSITNNDVLTSALLPTDVSSMTSLLRYSNNPLLSSISEMNNLTSISGSLEISGTQLSAFPNFPNLTSIGSGIFIRSNTNITALPTMPNLSTIGSTIDIGSNPLLASFDLSAVATSNINYMLVNNNDVLTSALLPTDVTSMTSLLRYETNPLLSSISEMNNLDSIGGTFTIRNIGLSTLPNFPNLTNIGGLSIQENNNLTELPTFNSNLIIASDLTIINNPQLGSCSIIPVCNYLSGMGTRNISNNSGCCLDETTVIDDCTNCLCSVGTATGLAQTWTKNSVKSNWDGASNVYAHDIDKDGDMDFVGVANVAHEVAWFENDGNQNFAEHQLASSVGGPEGIYVIDLDEDGDEDILISDFNEIFFYENDGTQTFTENIIVNGLSNCGSVFAIDMDGDLDLDVVTHSSNSQDIIWLENDGNESFTQHFVDNAYGTAAQDAKAADLDGDGDVDVIAAGGDCHWYENDGTQNFTKHLYSSEDLSDLYTVDFDFDGDLDILAGVGKIILFENDGSANFTAHEIHTPQNVNEKIHYLDFDADGDYDIVASLRFEHDIRWWENDGCLAFTEHTIENDFQHVTSVFAADIDGDGDGDVVAAAIEADELAWWKSGFGSVIYVDANATGAGTGTNWADAFTDLQDALDVANAYDEIWVAKGTYYPSQDSNGNTMPPENRLFYIDTDIKIYGGFPEGGGVFSARDWKLNPTILSGDVDYQTSPDDASPAIHYNQINGTNAIRVVTIDYTSSDCVLDGFTITAGAGPQWAGGGMAIHGHGSGNSASPIIRNCTFSGNKSENGGALLILGTSGGSNTSTIENCTFRGNGATYGQGRGGAIYIVASSGSGISAPNIINTQFFDNYGENGGAIFYLWTNAIPQMMNCTFFDNECTANGGAIYNFDSDLNFTNSIFWENHGNASSRTVFTPNGASNTFTYCLIEEADCNTLNGSNICDTNTIYNMDPLFVSEANYDLQLQACSPAIDEGTTNGAPAQDICDAPRPALSGIDMGAFEFQNSIPFITCYEDLDGDTFGNPNVSQIFCDTCGIGYVIDSNDCDDNDITINPNAVEICDGIDNNCNNQIDEGFSGILFVDINASGQNNGSTWADAFNDLQDAIDATQLFGCGNEIWVARGTYTPSTEMNPGSPQSKTFLLSGDLKIYGGFFGTETSIDQRVDSIAQQTYLSGDLDGDDVWSGNFPESCITQNGTNAYHVVWLDHVDSNFVIDGFVIHSGNASGSAPDDKGGGIYNDGSGSSSSPTLKNLWLIGNQAANHGGGLYNNATSGGTVNCNLIDVHFYCNSANFGGGLFNDATSGTSSNTFESCIFKSNTGAERAGSLYQNWVAGNLTDVFTNCLFSGNSASDGGAIFHRGSAGSTGNPTYNFCTFAANKADVGGTIMNFVATATLQNSIIWGNSSEITDLNGQVLGGHNIIENGYLPLSNTLDQNPMFINLPDFNTAPTFDGDFRLNDCSPGRDKGNAQTMPTEDLDNNMRPADADYDWGAYENVGAPCTTVRLYVNEANAPGNNGLTWATAFQDFQSALNVAKAINITEIWVAQGVYKPTNPEGFLIDIDLEVYGGFLGNEVNLADRDLDQYLTIFSGDADGMPDNTGGNIIATADSIIGPNYRIIRLTGENINSKFDGIIFTAGSHTHSGGAIFAQASGINGTVSSNPKFINCTFAGNRSYGGGAGIYVDATSSSNANVSTSPSIVNTKFYGNKASIRGGGLEVRASSSSGSATAEPSIVNTSFSFNSASHSGGGITVSATSNLGLASNAPEIINTTFAYNSALRGSGFYARSFALYAPTSSNVELKNSIFWQNNNDPIYVDGTGANHTLNIHNTLVQAANCASINAGNATTNCNGNMVFNQDPLFVNPFVYDLRIANGSPAIDVGNNTDLPVDTYDLDYDGNTAEQIPYDNLRLDRIYNGTVDMGAFENDGNYFVDPNAGLGHNTTNNDPPTVVNPPNPPAVLIRPITGHIFVKQDATGANNGTSWTDAYNEFQDALTVAEENDSIWVASGVYRPKIDTNGIALTQFEASKTFYVNRDLKILGGFAGTETMASQRDPNANPTILSGDLNGDDKNDDGNSISETIQDNEGINANHVLFLDTLTNACIFDGFIITGGVATGIVDPITNLSHSGGGGMLVYAGDNGKNSSPTISNCKFFGNYGNENGGAIHNFGANGGHAAPTISNCTFSGNFAAKGGAIANDGTIGGEAAPNIDNCQFMENDAFQGGVIWNYGYTAPMVSHSIFELNEAQIYGGAIFNSGGDTTLHMSNGMFKLCTFKGNISNRNGGAVFNNGNQNGMDSTKFINCLFSGNRATKHGGSIFNYGENGNSAPKFTNCTFAASSEDNGGGAMTNFHSTPALKNNIFWGNSSEIQDAVSVPEAAMNIVENGYLLDDEVITSDPIFMNLPDYNNAPTTAGDFNIAENSAGIDMGIDSLIFADSILVDLATNPRRTDGDYDEVRQVDIGAYEYQSRICDEVHLVITDGAPGEYAADQTITTIGSVIIIDPDEATYMAEQEITLDVGFEVELGAVFDALIGPCTTQIPNGL